MATTNFETVDISQSIIQGLDNLKNRVDSFLAESPDNFLVMFRYVDLKLSPKSERYLIIPTDTLAELNDDFQNVINKLSATDKVLFLLFDYKNLYEYDPNKPRDGQHQQFEADFNTFKAHCEQILDKTENQFLSVITYKGNSK